MSKADAKFITPLDKSDLHPLSHALDDISDTLESAVARVALYWLTTARPDLTAMTERLTQLTQATHQGAGFLHHLKDHKALALR